MQTEMMQAIEQYRRWGLSPFPIPHRSKKPTIKWKRLRHVPLSPLALKAYFKSKSNVALICGQGFIALDFDSPDDFTEWATKFKENWGIDITEATPVVATGGGGHHVYLRMAKAPKTRQLPRVRIQGKGAYVIAPPSVHPNGNRYRFVNGTQDIMEIKSLANIGIDLEDNRDASETWQAPDAWGGIDDSDRGKVISLIWRLYPYPWVRQGEEWKTNCIFTDGHRGGKDSQPSLFIHPGKGVWYCHGCSRGGKLTDFALKLAELFTTKVNGVVNNCDPIPLVESFDPTLAKKMRECRGWIKRARCQDCGHEFDTDQYYHCDSGFCDNCMRRRAKRLLAGYAKVIRQMENPRIIELTPDSIDLSGYPEAEAAKILRDNQAKVVRRFNDARRQKSVAGCRFTQPYMEGGRNGIRLLLLVEDIDIDKFLSACEEQGFQATLNEPAYLPAFDFYQRPRAFYGYETARDLRIYLSAFRKVRLFQTFGAVYGKRIEPEKTNKCCPKCGSGKLYTWWEKLGEREETSTTWTIASVPDYPWVPRAPPVGVA